ncbi:uncharacterized protein IL334_005499 [Kwoniella shivajii]|uniref:SIT4-associating protein/190 n=1 Tax=Kwoniella shivajii TaxID=564305 RepID=A0ABZ1D4L8_9TREE|nr:hypothetical protein IL334_005499 [Kwoniella shivajii]
MLWRFSFASNSTLDALLTRDITPSLEEVLDEQDILSECKAQNQKLVSYLSREESVKSLLQWVVAGLDELNQQAKEAENECLNIALTSPDLYPSYRPSTSSPSSSRPLVIPGTGPNSPPLETPNLVNVDLNDTPKNGEINSEEKVDDNGDDTAEITSQEEKEEEDDEFDGSDVGLGRGLRRKSEGEDDIHRSKYPSLATEILCCVELWSVSETIIHNPEYLLAPFWDAILPPINPDDPKSEANNDTSSNVSRQEASERERARNEFWSEKDEERDRRREMIRGMWMRVNGALMTKRTPEMMRFIQSLPNIVERIVARIASPAVQDILIRIVSSEESGVSGVIDWLADEGLITRLLIFLSPHYSTSVHSVIAEILKSIITLCAPLPFNPHGGNAMEQQAGQGQATGIRDNRLIRELISEPNVKIMLGFMLDDIELTDSDWNGRNGPDSEDTSPSDPFIVHPLPSIASATSSLTHICSILVEVIRRNNSDFSEPHLFHTLRNRLMSVRMQPQTNGVVPSNPTEGESEIETEQEKEEKDRRHMEEALADMSSRMGIVHLGHLLDLISQGFGRLNHFVIRPRSQDRSASVAVTKPFTLERFRILELYAELLHSSNMSILNRVPGTGPAYTEEGILSGGLEGLEALGEAIDGDQAGEDDNQNQEDRVTLAKELPVSSGSTDASLTESDDVASDDAEMLENIDDDATPSHSPSASKVLELPKSNGESTPATVPPPPSPADVERLRDVMGIESRPSSLSVVSEAGAASNIAVANSTAAPSIASSDKSDPIPAEELDSEFKANPSAPPPMNATPKCEDLSKFAPGDRLKRQYIINSVIPTVVNLFFEYPNNDFMHHVVYDILQQILNGRLGPGLNSELVVELIVKAKLVERVIEAQRLNDRMVAQSKCPRLPYMGHITLISEELVKFFSRCPPELYNSIKDSFIQSEWEAFVGTSLKEAKARDTHPLAGGKPMTSMNNGSISESEGISGTNRDEESSSDEEDGIDQVVKFGEPLTRTVAQDGFAHRGTGDNDFDNFGEDENGNGDEEGMDRFWRNSGVGLGRRMVDSSDDDDDDADWLRPSPNTAWGNNGGADEDDFGAWETAGPNRQGGKDEFDDDDGWGNFASGSPAFASPNASANAEDPFKDEFAPSVVRAEPAPNAEPLTPRDWAEQFDRAFREGSDPSSSSNNNGVTAIVVPNLDEEEDDEEEEEEEGHGDHAKRMSMSAGTSSWTFQGDDEGVDLPPTISPTIPTPASGGFDLGPALPSVPIPKSLISTSPRREPPKPIPSSPIRENISSSPTRSRRLSSSSSTSSTASSSSSPLSTSPLSPSTNPILTSSSTSIPPINIPRRRGSRGHAPHPGHPSGTSPNSPNSSRNKWGIEAFSPPNPSLIAAATEESPLGPGVSPDTKITDRGMLQRQVNGKTVTVPQDEIVEAIERAQDDSEDEREESAESPTGR